MREPETAHFARVARVLGRHFAAADDDSPALDREDPGQCGEKLALAVAGDARDADDLARPNRKADAVDPGNAAVVDQLQVLDFEHSLPRLGLLPLDPQQDFAADHQLRQLLRRGLRCL